jgi:very-short-patch-repair endonuclease
VTTVEEKVMDSLEVAGCFASPDDYLSAEYAADGQRRLAWFRRNERLVGSPAERVLLAAFTVWGHTRPQVQFPVGKYRVDFAFPDVKLVVEVDGADFHASKEARGRDNERDRCLMLDGWRVVRFTGSQVWQNAIACAANAQDVYLSLKSARISM